MVSQTHEGLVLLFRNRPELAPELLRDALGIALPDYSEVRVESADLTEAAPVEARADLVVLLVNGRPVMGIVLEVQLDKDAQKRFTWPLYGVGARVRFECPCVVMVVAPKASVARWAAAPIELGPGSRFTPLVIGPDAVPVVTDEAQAIAEPELAILSVIAHGQGDVERAVRIALAASVASESLDEDLGLLYSSLIRAALSDAARKAFQMLPQGQRFFDEDMQRSFEKGEAKGKAEGKAEGVLAVLEARGLPLSVDERERIQNCTDLAVLDRWLHRAVTVTTARELFE
jgi:hypothetical protein